MVESAAHLVDHVFPEAPVRQFVLTFPYPLRFLLAAEPKALTEVLAVVQRGISTFLIKRAGFTLASGARAGAVTLIQRFGSALNLNTHLHMLLLDGAYRFRGNKARFHRARRPTNAGLSALLDRVHKRATASLGHFFGFAKVVTSFSPALPDCDRSARRLRRDVCAVAKLT